jgi:general secretion pathway protein M
MQVSPFTRKFLALTLLLACLFALFRFVAEPLYTEYNANRAAIAQIHQLESRYLSIAAGRPDLAHRLREIEAGVNLSELSYPAASDALTGASMQSTVKDLVSDAGGRLNSSQILAAVEESGFRRIAIRVQMVADVTSLQSILYELESRQPYLFIDNVTIRANRASRRRQVRRRSNRPEAIRPANEDELNIRFDVLGYARPGAA